jgi:ribose transport system substrate-binding protein
MCVALTAEAAPAADRKKIGMVVKNATTEYIQAFIIGATQTCEELGIDIQIVDAQADSLKIMDAIDTFIAQGIDGFILAGAEDLKTLVPGIEALNAENIPVMALDTCPEGGHVDMFLTFDIVDSSRKAAEQMIAGLKEANGGEVPKGTVIEVTGSLVDMFQVECNNGFKSVMDKYPQLSVVQGEGKWNNDDSYNRVSDLLTKHGDDVVAVYVHTPDIMGAGTVAAIESAGLDPKNYFISGICVGLEGIELLNQKKLYAVVEQPALDSSIMAVRYMNDLFNGKELPAVGDIIVEEGALWSPAKVIDNEFAKSGKTMILQGPLVPLECSPDDARLWENRIGK